MRSFYKIKQLCHQRKNVSRVFKVKGRNSLEELFIYFLHVTLVLDSLSLYNIFTDSWCKT